MSVPAGSVGYMIIELFDEDTGEYRIRTGTGSYYLLDLDRRTLTRLKAAAPLAPEYAYEAPVDLRRDGEPLDVLLVSECSVGERGLFILQVGDIPSMPTVRSTSEVMEIIHLAGPTIG